jgi:hypothetical protein
MMMSPKSPKRSYLDKGPTKQQLARRNLLKSKLLFDDDDSSDGFAVLNDTAEGGIPSANEEGPPRRGKMRQGVSRSLSPKTFGRTLLRRGERSRDRSGDQTEDQGKDLTKSPKPPRRRIRGTTGFNDISQSPNPKAAPRRSISTTGFDDASRSPKPRPPQRSSSINPKLQQSRSTDDPGNAQKPSHSLSPRRVIRRFVGETEPGLDGMRRSLIADKKQLDDLQCKFDQEDEPPDDETLMERVARRVAANRRGKMQKSNTDGEKIEAMQVALKRRQEMEREDDEGIGGIWAKGLKALEKVYDDLNT